MYDPSPVAANRSLPARPRRRWRDAPRFNSAVPGVRLSFMMGRISIEAARARRQALAPVRVEIDVFAPGGTRAVRIDLPHQ